MQIDPIKSMLKPPGTKHLKLKCDMLLSTFAFKFNLHRYSEAAAGWYMRAAEAAGAGNSSTCRLNVTHLYTRPLLG